VSAAATAISPALDAAASLFCEGSLRELPSRGPSVQYFRAIEASISKKYCVDKEE
jgi:hypothetical protein